jgi:hypothetical protein
VIFLPLWARTIFSTYPSADNVQLPATPFCSAFAELALAANVITTGKVARQVSQAFAKT